jgi:hypothetical protein
MLQCVIINLVLRILVSYRLIVTGGHTGHRFLLAGKKLQNAFEQFDAEENNTLLIGWKVTVATSDWLECKGSYF